MNKMTILGCGTSTGVPILGCKCRICQSSEMRNKRLRTSALIEFSSGKKVLIDASPDLRTQLLRAQIDSLDAVIITHDHADHTGGMDDLRPFGFSRKEPIPVYADAGASDDLKRKYRYIFERKQVFKDKPILGGGIPMLDLETLVPGQQTIVSEAFEFFPVPHGHEDTMIFMQGKLGYVVDCRELSSNVLKSFHDRKLDLLVIDCLQRKPHQTHLHLDLCLEYIQKISPKLAVLTHMGHEFDYPELMAELRLRGFSHVFPAIDGLSFHYSS